MAFTRVSEKGDGSSGSGGEDSQHRPASTKTLPITFIGVPYSPLPHQAASTDIKGQY